jgi:hypothetical protein
MVHDAVDVDDIGPKLAKLGREFWDPEERVHSTCMQALDFEGQAAEISISRGWPAPTLWCAIARKN